MKHWNFWLAALGLSAGITVADALAQAEQSQVAQQANQTAQTDVAPDSARAIGELARAGQRVDRMLSALEPVGFSGYAVVALGDEVLLSKGYGYADRATREAMTPQTVSTMGSITKQFTAAGILKLADQGKLGLQDPLSRFFDNAPKDKRDITVHQLLTHTSGLAEIGEYGDDDPIGAEEFVRLAFAQELLAPPGEQFEYTNTGYSILGIIIEGLSGQSYERWLREQLLVPAGLNHTGYQLAAWDGLVTAKGYSRGQAWGEVLERGWREDGPGWILRANGGLHTVAADMLAWRDVLRGTSQLLSESSRQAWIAPQVEEGPDSFYGYGWEVHPDTPIGKMVAHNGGNGIFSADFVWFEQPDLFFYIAGNQNVIDATGLRDALFEAIFDPDVMTLPQVQRWDGATASRASALQGSYAEGALTIAADDLNLLVTVRGQSAINAGMGIDETTAQHFAKLSERAEAAIPGLLQASDEAFAHFIEDGEQASARANSLINWIKGFEEMAGPLGGLQFYGTIPAVPGRTVEGAQAVSVMAAEFEGGMMVLGMNWGADDAYLGTTIGPPSDLPSLVLMPVAENQWRSWNRGATELGGLVSTTLIDARPCIVQGDEHLCRDEN